ncbi:MAG TPA: hypothetical protein DD738_14680 [Ruminiclostridium sp.]|nr:hypothetical protein [Ruminiclostridium sp.]
MPRRNGAGPKGAGSMTGRGFGLCSGTKAVKHGAGLEMGLGLGRACRRGFGHGFGRGFAAIETGSKQQKELLQEQRSLLQNRLEIIDKRLKGL